MKKFSSTAAALAAAAVLGTGLGAVDDAVAPERKFISIGPGGPTGV